MKLQIISIMLILSMILTGCGEVPIRADDSLATEAGVKKVVNANNQFALELYSELDEGENVFFSPYSISTALAMTYEGAKGETAAEMAKVFHFPTDDVVRRSNFAKVYNLINTVDKEYQLTTANA